MIEEVEHFFCQICVHNECWTSPAICPCYCHNQEDSGDDDDDGSCNCPICKPNG